MKCLFHRRYPHKVQDWRGKPSDYGGSGIPADAINGIEVLRHPLLYGWLCRRTRKYCIVGGSTFGSECQTCAKKIPISFWIYLLTVVFRGHQYQWVPAKKPTPRTLTPPTQTPIPPPPNPQLAWLSVKHIRQVDMVICLIKETNNQRFKLPLQSLRYKPLQHGFLDNTSFLISFI